MKTIFCTLLLLLFSNLLIAQHKHEDHSHVQQVSNAREMWGDFEEGQLIKSKLVDWTQTPIAGKVLKNGVPKKEFAFVDSIDIYSVVYDSDGLMVTGFMVKPKEQGEYPCVIFNRGGNRDMGQLVVGTALAKLGLIAKHGYIVIASNYRGNSNSEGKEEFGGSDVRDVTNLIPALGQVEGADTSRIGMVGVSRGGMMTYLAMRETCNIKAAAVIGGLSDMFILKDKRPEMETHVMGEIIPHYYDSTKVILTDRSANMWVDKMCADTKLLILHGEKDDRCDVSMARDLHKNLKSIQYPHVYREYKGDDHGLSDHIFEAMETIGQWLDKYVKEEQVFDEKEDHIVVK